MKDAAVYDLASDAGIAIEWQDYAERPHRVSLDTIRHILTALGLPCANARTIWRRVASSSRRARRRR